MPTASKRSSLPLPPLTNPREKERRLVARMATTGHYTLVVMAEAVEKATSTIQIWISKLLTGGVDALVRPKKLPDRYYK